MTLIRALIVTGMTDMHHDWRTVTPLLGDALTSTDRFDVRITEEFRGASAATLASYDVVVLNYYGVSDPWAGKPDCRWGAETDAALEAFVAAGGGLVAYHASLQLGAGWDINTRAMFGGRLERECSRRAPNSDFIVSVASPEHPITSGMPRQFPHYDDDLYVNLDWEPDAAIEPLLTGWDNPLRYTQVPSQFDALPGMGKDHPLAWTNIYGCGRVFGTGLGHGPAAVSRPTFRSLFSRGTEWAATGSVTIPLEKDFGDPVPGGDWWPTRLEPAARRAYESMRPGQ